MTNKALISLISVTSLVIVLLASASMAVAQSGRDYGSLFFSGPVVDGPQFCFNASLGGPVTYPFDSDRDGVADTCSLPRTRRAAAARHNALEQLGTELPDRLGLLFNGYCRRVPGTFGEPDAEAIDECAIGRLRSNPVLPSSSQPYFYSGPVIDGPQFCFNASLGGPVTYPFDSDRDGVADTCSLPRTRRAAAARHNALEQLGTEHNKRLAFLWAEQCASVPDTFGEDSAEAKDKCSKVGDIEVFVHYCAPQRSYTAKQMADEVSLLNEIVAKYYERESSGLANLRFTLGTTISPDIQWHDTDSNSIHEWHRQIDASGGYQRDPCDSSIPDEWRQRQILVLAAVPHNDKVAGYAYKPRDLAIVPTRDNYTFEDSGYNTLIAHELGHSVFDLEDVGKNGEPRSSCLSNWPLMDWRVCTGMWSPETLNNAEVVCEEREQLNWPCGTGTVDQPGLATPQPQYPFANRSSPGVNEYKCRRYNQHTSDRTGYILTGTGDIDPWAFFGGECTSYVAFRLNQDQTDVRFHNQYLTPGYPHVWFPNWGNAVDWAERARDVGVAVDESPRPGSVAYWDGRGSNSAGNLGHLAYVEQVNSDGSIVISDMNWKSSCQVRENVTLQRGLTGLDNMQWPDKFIHLETRTG